MKSFMEENICDHLGIFEESVKKFFYAKIFRKFICLLV